VRAADAIYDYYAEDLYDYSLTFLDTDAAADALHDALLVSIAWSNRLEARDQFGLWLYALTRNECLRILRRTGGLAAPAGAHSAEYPRRGPYSTDDERAYGALREVHDLVHRHAFTVREIATVLGVSPSRAQALQDRAEEQFGGGRHGAGAKPHPRPPLPRELRSRVLASANLPSRVTYRGELAAPRLRNGYPVPLDRIEAYRRGRTLKLVGAAAAVLVVVGAAFMVPTGSRHNVVGLLGSSRPASEVVGSPVDGIISASPSRSPGGGEPVGGVKAPGAGAPKSAAPNWEPPPGGQPKTVPAGAISGVGGKCVEAMDGALSAGAVQLFQCSAKAAGQRWSVPGDGTLRTLRKCMQVRNGGTTDGTEIQLQVCDGSPAQKWEHRRDGSLYNVQAKRCLEAPTLNASEATQLVIWRCTKGDNQFWTLPTH
jgi:DNA-directed RNA polymerase specialized sigma24 family protein